MDTRLSTAVEGLGRIVADGNVLGAIDAVLQGFQNSLGFRSIGETKRLHNETLQLRSKIVRLERDTRAGLIGRDVRLVEWAVITEAALSILDEVMTLADKGRFSLVVPDFAAPPLVPPAGPQAGVADGPQVFLSYARPDRKHILEIAARVQFMGFSVWYDHYIGGGARFSDVILEKLTQAKAVVVLWTERSVMSDWVLFEASRAHQLRKLIPVRSPGLELSRIPPPYAAVLNVLTTDQSVELKSAVSAFVESRI
jgi:TIR domain